MLNQLDFSLHIFFAVKPKNINNLPNILLTHYYALFTFVRHYIAENQLIMSFSLHITHFFLGFLLILLKFWCTFVDDFSKIRVKMVSVPRCHLQRMMVGMVHHTQIINPRFDHFKDTCITKAIQLHFLR